jgi:predicted membrane channel-forming protein YqfA (hemolysin III family)
MSNENDFNQPGKTHWIISIFVALTLLIILFGLAFLVSGREVIQKPLLSVFIVLAWFGLLGGIVVSRRDD